MKDRIQQEVDRTLECLNDGLDIPADPLFAKRLSQRVAGVRMSRSGGVGSRISYPVVIVLLIVLNLAAGVMRFRAHQSSSEVSSSSESVLASEYGLGQNDLASF